MGQYTDMFDFLRELEQWFECRGVECELEQLSHEFQQQCGGACRLQFHLRPVSIGRFLAGIVE